jgi:hypothetical protein
MSIEASSSGFGAVFTDVDEAGATAVRFFNTEGVAVFSRDALSSGGDASVSFLGVTFRCACIGKVEITLGTGAVLFSGSPNDVSQGGEFDIVVLDDLIYGEPQPLASTVGVTETPGSKCWPSTSRPSAA